MTAFRVFNRGYQVGAEGDVTRTITYCTRTLGEGDGRRQAFEIATYEPMSVFAWTAPTLR